MKRINLVFDDDVFATLQEYCRRHEIIDKLDINNCISHDSECFELTKKLENYLQYKIDGMLGYNYIMQYRRFEFKKGSPP